MFLSPAPRPAIILVCRLSSTDLARLETCNRIVSVQFGKKHVVIVALGSSMNESAGVKRQYVFEFGKVLYKID